MSEGEWVEESRPAVQGLTPAQEIVVRIIAIAKRHGYADSSVTGFLGWLEDRLTLADAIRLERAKESGLEPHPSFQDNPDHRPPGLMTQKMRQVQAQSASMAMVMMADDLQRAYEEISRLRARLLEREGHAQLP